MLSQGSTPPPHGLRDWRYFWHSLNRRRATKTRFISWRRDHYQIIIRSWYRHREKLVWHHGLLVDLISHNLNLFWNQKLSIKNQSESFWCNLQPINHWPLLTAIFYKQVGLLIPSWGGVRFEVRVGNVIVKSEFCDPNTNHASFLTLTLRGIFKGFGWGGAINLNWLVIHNRVRNNSKKVTIYS